MVKDPEASLQPPTVPPPASEVELEIERIAAGGDGVGRDPAGRVVFVPRTAPGDRVRARIVRTKARWARAVPLGILREGEGRIAAPCPHYAFCGGCQLQHLGADVQADVRRSVLQEVLARIGGLEVAVPAPERGELEWGYRNRVTFTLLRQGREVRAGYHRWDDPRAVRDVDDCPLAESAIRVAWKALRKNWGPAASVLPGGRRLRLTLRASTSGRVSLHVGGGRPSLPGKPEQVEAAVEHLESYTWQPRRGRTRTLAGRPYLVERWEDLDLRLRPGVFLQVNRTLTPVMERWIDAFLRPAPGRRLEDVYAGVGLRGVRWARAGAAVTAFERNADAVYVGRRAAREAGVRLRFVVGSVENHLERVGLGDGLAVNPPRAGLSAQLTARLHRAAARRLVYVSCDPATLARDLGRLGEIWRVVAVQPFDAFPQTAHLETVVWLERR